MFKKNKHTPSPRLDQAIGSNPVQIHPVQGAKLPVRDSPVHQHIVLQH